jgi:hypothetical protein
MIGGTAQTMTTTSFNFDGNVGIGTTSPANKLHVHSTDNVASYAVPQVLITADPASSHNQWASLELRGSYIGNTVTYGVGIRSTYGWDSNNRYYGDFNIWTADKSNGNNRTDRLRVTSEGNTEVNGDLSILGGEMVVKKAGLYEFTSHTFTPCGATGKNGPSLSDCTTAYSSTTWASNTAFFEVASALAGYQLWTVPMTGDYDFIVMGASDGWAYGKGRKITARYTLTAGDKYYICVGQLGLMGSGNGNWWASGGGGGTFVVKYKDGYNITGYTIDDVLIIAGGGGGSNASSGAAGDQGDNAPSATTSIGVSTAGGTWAANSNGGGSGAGFIGDGQGWPSDEADSWINGLEGAGGYSGSGSGAGGFGGGGDGGGNSGGGGGGVSGGNTQSSSLGGTGGGSYFKSGYSTYSDNTGTVGHGYVTITFAGTPPAFVGIGTTSPYSNLHINKGTGSAVWNTNFKPADCHLYLGGYEWGVVGTTLKFGFGYMDRIDGNIPCYMGARVEGTSVDGEYAIVFGTRNSNADTVVPGERMCITHDGNVGIGTTSPGYKLEIVGSNTTGTVYGTATMHPGGSYFYSNHNNNTSVSAKFSSGLWCAGGNIMVSSDERIKENVVDVSDNLALEMVRDIPCRYYEYKDKYSRGTEKTIGFIAQEVKAILPMAVGVEPNIIPNEMRNLENISWEEITDNSSNQYKLKTDLNNCSGIKYRFYVSDGNDETMKEVVGNSDNTFTFDTSYNNVFCYGKEIDDFHTLDKAKLFSLNFSATQELDRQQQADKAEIAELKTKVATLESELAAIKQHLGI